MSLFDRGDEVFKAAIHGATGILLCQQAIYNVIVYRRRGTCWHLFSAVTYIAIIGLELVQVTRHARDYSRERLDQGDERARRRAALSEMRRDAPD